MERSLGNPIDIFQIFCVCPQTDIHQQYHRRLQSSAQESDKKQDGIFYR